METQTQVSEDVLKAAEAFAKEVAMKFNGKRHLVRSAVYAGFIAGAAYMKPIEHEKLPDNGTGNS